MVQSHLCFALSYLVAWPLLFLHSLLSLSLPSLNLAGLLSLTSLFFAPLQWSAVIPAGGQLFSGTYLTGHSLVDLLSHLCFSSSPPQLFPAPMIRNPEWDQWSRRVEHNPDPSNPEWGAEPPFYKQWTEDDLDELVQQQFERHPRLVSTAKAMTDYGDWGYTLISAADLWQQDWDNISDVPRACKWHPPQVAPSERIRNAHIRALAVSASHPWPNIFRDPIARLQYIGQQMDDGASGHSGLVGPCSWCGTFTGLWCDGVEATTSSIGWNCRVPVCSWCRSVFSECRRCSVHTGIPLQMDPRAIVQVCRVKPNSCTKRLLEFREVSYSEMAVGIFHIIRAIEGTIHLRLTCFTSYGGFYFPHIDKKL